MKIQYMIFNTRLVRPHSLHDTKKDARKTRKELYGYSDYIIIQVIIGDLV